MIAKRLVRFIAPAAFSLAGLTAGPAHAAVDYHERLAAWEAAFNSHDAEKVGSVYAPDVVLASVKAKGWVEEHGVKAAEAQLAPYFTAFPDVRLAATRVFRQGDTLIVEWVSVGTNTGSLGGAPPSGKPAGIRGINLLTYDKKGLIKRSAVLFDEVTLAQQVGLAPGPARAVPAWPTAPAVWLESDKSGEGAKVVAAAKATWPAAWSKRDAKAYDAVIADESIHRELAGPNDFKGRPALQAELATYAKALPDMHASIDQAWGFGDVAVLKFTFKGTMRGDIGPFKATNKPVVIHGIDVDQIRDGKMMVGDTYSNATELLTELGVLPMKK